MAAVLLTQLPVNVREKVMEDDSSVWDPAPTWGNLDESPDFFLAQIWPLKLFGVVLVSLTLACNK